MTKPFSIFAASGAIAFAIASMLPAEAAAQSRIFQLHIVNNLQETRSFTVDNWDRCYEGDGRDYRSFSLAPGERHTLTIARVQGNGCDGKNGHFTIRTDRWAIGQRFTFDNEGNLEILRHHTTEGVYFRGTLSPKAADESFTWSISYGSNTGPVG